MKLSQMVILDDPCNYEIKVQTICFHLVCAVHEIKQTDHKILEILLNYNYISFAYSHVKDRLHLLPRQCLSSTLASEHLRPAIFHRAD